MITVASWISRPFGPYHSPPASNWGDWWVVLGLDLLRSDWSKIGGWIRSLAESPNVWRVRSASTDWQAAFGPKPPRPHWPYLVAGRLIVEMGPTWPQSPYNAVGNWRIVQLCDRRQMYGTSALVYPTCLPVAPFGRQTGTTASDLAVLTSDLVLADNRRFPFLLHAQAVARCMPKPSLGAPVPSRSLIFGEELFDRVARL